jgi:glycosyltransferase involved in cell wall biosynthesis
MDPAVRVLMVTPYPPARDGIADYAVQEVATLLRAGHDVQVLSPYPSAAHQHLDLVGRRGALALAKRLRGYDKVIVQFHPDVFYPLPKVNLRWAQTSAALQLPFRLASSLEVRVHEIDYRDGRDRGPLGLASRALWRLPDLVTFHTERERDEFVAAFGRDRARTAVIPHGSHFQQRTVVDPETARASLGLPPDATVFLVIGFIQPHKGADRAIKAFGGLDPTRCRLDIVGSAPGQDGGYLAELEALAAGTPGVHLHVGYLSQESFDRWLVASDAVVLPYRHIWSSGVLERAALYQKPVIASAVGGLPEQASQHSAVTLVADDVELARALRRFAGGDPPAPPPSWPAEGPELRSAVQAVVAERATVLRGSRRPAGGAPEPGVASRADPAGPLRGLPRADLPVPRSNRLVAGVAKRLIRRLTAWELEPLVHQLNAVQDAAATAVERAAAAPGEPPPAAGSKGRPRARRTARRVVEHGSSTPPDSQ